MMAALLCSFLVFLTEKLGAAHEDMKHLIVFLACWPDVVGDCVRASQRHKYKIALF